MLLVWRTMEGVWALMEEAEATLPASDGALIDDPPRRTEPPAKPLPPPSGCSRGSVPPHPAPVGRLPSPAGTAPPPPPPVTESSPIVAEEVTEAVRGLKGKRDGVRT